MASPSNVSYPTLSPSAPIGGGLSTLTRALPAAQQFSDMNIRGALKINPALAVFYVQGKYTVEKPLANRENQPLEVKDKVVSQTQAGSQSPSWWDSRPLGDMDPRILFGSNKPQKAVAVPWNKKFIPPLALFNDASQWVNTLMFNRPMQRTGNGDSNPNITGVYLGSQRTPPDNVDNFAAGMLNAQLQLGTLAIQAQQLTISASNYFGGS